MAMRSRRRAAAAGYTLIEMIMVVLIIGLMLTLVFTRLDLATPRYALRAAARDVSRLINLAKSQAITLGRIHYVQYDLKEGAYRILAPYEKAADPEAAARDLAAVPELGWEETMHRSLPRDVRFKDVAFGTGVPSDSGLVTIQISPFGTTTGHVVHLTNEKEDFSVDVNPLTGVAALTDSYVQPPAVLTDPDDDTR
ncbi:MAG: prepilin-type N-terminal cleavage/methylation domain-containing protein [Planctomycetes bacterium]|nr:prepilin-type N-terminal cleavage/methylation domain-containing protein [Planctomycetota bacterium]